MTDNELIAQFMGFRLDGVEYEHRFAHHPDKGAMLINRMKYHESWDWLMPVVEKIDRLGFSVTIRRTRTIIETVLTGRIVESIHPDYSMLNVTYQAVIEFIKWYNTQKSGSVQNKLGEVS